MNSILQTHRAELARAMRNRHYERSPAGLVFTKQKAVVNGLFETAVNGLDVRLDPNMVVDQGLDDVLNVYFGNVAKRTAFYVAPFAGNVAITDALTAATFTATQTEFTNYTQSARVAWVTPTTTSTQTMSNTASPAVLTMDTGGGTIWGCGLLTAQAKSATTGVLVAASLFAASRILLAADELSVKYIITAADTP